MTSTDDPSNAPSEQDVSGDDAPVRGELVDPDAGSGPDGDGEFVTEPAKVLRIGSMVKQLLEEVRATDLDEPSRERLAEIYERSVTELADALSPELQEELRNLSLPFDHDSVPSGAELRVAKAQLVGWLEGLFHGIQATLVAQQFAARQQLEQMRQLPGGPGGPGPGMMPPGSANVPPSQDRPGTYL